MVNRAETPTTTAPAVQQLNPTHQNQMYYSYLMQAARREHERQKQMVNMLNLVCNQLPQVFSQLTAFCTIVAASNAVCCAFLCMQYSAWHMLSVQIMKLLFWVPAIICDVLTAISWQHFNINTVKETLNDYKEIAFCTESHSTVCFHFIVVWLLFSVSL